MIEQIVKIELPLPYKVSVVNSYLVRTSEGFFLIDTGMTNARRQLETTLDHFCSQPGDLKLILLTHGDFDHTGNARYMRDKYRAPIAMHPDDAPMLENGDMFWKRKTQNRPMKNLMKLFIRFGKKDQCTPDIFLVEGDSLTEYGLGAQVLNTPGHSSGSLCFLTSPDGYPRDDSHQAHAVGQSGALFCGDLFKNSFGKPRLNSLLYDNLAGEASFNRLKSLPIKMVYPGHGKPFPWSALVN